MLKQTANNGLTKRAGLRGFTLIELLVVIAIIALLLSIILPALRKVKEHGKISVCLAHSKGLLLSWRLYAEENKDQLTMGTPYALTPSAAAPSGYVLLPVPLATTGSWKKWQHMVGSKSWVGIEITVPRRDASAREKLACITEGALFSYAGKAADVYWCPSGERDERRTFSIVDAMNGTPSYDGIPHRRLSEVKSPGQRFVFVDEGFATPGSWTIPMNKIKWHDAPPLRHNDRGDNFAYADGHASHYLYKDPKTINFFARGNPDSITSEQCAQNNEDFDFIQRGCWGGQVKIAP